MSHRSNNTWESESELYWQSVPEDNELESTQVDIMTLMWLVGMALEDQCNINIDQSKLISCRIYGDKLLMRRELSSESAKWWRSSTARVPGELFAVFMNLHLSALKLIQLLTDSSLRDKTHTRKMINALSRSRLPVPPAHTTTKHSYCAAVFSTLITSCLWPLFWTTWANALGL